MRLLGEEGAPSSARPAPAHGATLVHRTTTSHLEGGDQGRTTSCADRAAGRLRRGDGDPRGGGADAERANGTPVIVTGVRQHDGRLGASIAATAIRAAGGEGAERAG